jgi:flagellar hook-associated protein 1 FlgK
MSDLLTLLNTGASSLAAQRAAMQTAAHNLQNANTPGYARQRVAIEATLPGDRMGHAWIGRGAILGAVTQSRDRFLEAQIPGQLGEAARNDTAARALEAVSVLDPEASGGLGEALSGFYSALRALSQNPGDTVLRQSAIGTARTLGLAFNRTRGALEDARTGADAKLGGAVGEVNDLARSVADLNLQIRAARAGGVGEPNDLLDARQKAVDRLAEVAGGVPVPTSEGDVNVALPGGLALVTGGAAASLSLAPDAANGGHLAISLVTPGGSRVPAAPGGELGGLLDARDGALGDAVRSVDQLAWDLAGAVNAVHRAGTGLDGSTGQDLLDPGATQDGAAARFAVASAVLADHRRLATARGGGSGDGANALALVATETSADPHGALSRVIGQFGAAARGVRAAADQALGLRDHLATMREAASGVSIDEELIEMQKAQRAFQAISKVIQASSEMFDTLLQLK